MLRARSTIALIVALWTTACATTISGKTQRLRLTSEPSGATVLIEPGWFEVKTPVELEVKRLDGPLRLTFTLDGYEPYRAYVEASTNPLAIVDILIPTGMEIDLESGADTALSPTAVHAPLAKER
jgi:hypothetical protein